MPRRWGGALVGQLQEAAAELEQQQELAATAAALAMM